MLLRVFPRRTSYTPDDPYAVVGAPTLFVPPDVDEVHVSVTFSWDVAEGRRLATLWAGMYPGVPVRLGGPAIAPAGDDFVPGRYVRQGVVFTSRGCTRKCPFCLVPEREGPLRILPVTGGYVVNDNNFLACPQEHREAVYAMLRTQRKWAVFAGGIDARLVDARIASEFTTINIDHLFLACDSDRAVRALQNAAGQLAFLGREKLRTYCLVGFGDDTPERAARRLEACWQVGTLPFAQYYRPPSEERRASVPPEWQDLVRLWSRPALMRAAHRAVDNHLSE